MSKARINTKVITKVASLANIALTPEETSVYANQLENIFQFIDILDTVDTTNLPPTFQVSNLTNQTRLDLPVPSMSKKDVLKPSQNTNGDYIVAPKTINRE